MSDVKEFEVDGKDLPLHCPTKDTPLWDAHPRVFLDVAKTGQVSCPYCGTRFKLKPGTQVHHH